MSNTDDEVMKMIDIGIINYVFGRMYDDMADGRCVDTCRQYPSKHKHDDEDKN